MPVAADLLVRALERAGVRVVFGLPGVHNLAAFEALRTSAAIRTIGVRHEQAAAYAADGHARATGEVGVALVTTGPGAANTLGAVGEAWASGTPLVVIATDVPASLKRPGIVGGALHESADQRAMFAPVTKATVRVTDPADLGHATAQALATALAAPQRPVLLEVPTDVLAAAVTGDEPTVAGAPAYAETPDVDQALPHLLAAQRPIVWAGGGALRAGAGPTVAALAQRLGAPVLTTYAARGLLAGHPFLVGLPPHVPEAGELWDRADLVLAVGSDLDGMSTMNWRLPQPPRLVAVNVDAADATKNYRADAVVVADAVLGCEELLEGLDEAGHAPPQPADTHSDALFGGTASAWYGDLAALRAGAVRRLRIEHPAELAFVDVVARTVPSGTTVVADMCVAGYWLAALHEVPGPRRFQYPMGWGTLGYALPAAIGSAATGTPTVAFCGDGGLLLACGELATVQQERLGLTLVVVDDGGYGMLRHDQDRAGTPRFGVDLAGPDHVALAQAFGLRAERVDGLGEAFGAALAAHLADPAPSVLVAAAALAPPPTTSPRWHRQGPPAWAVP
ncbi:thiamine pyrophosphate-binding protein [Conexibacter sp. W3-3-2]|uniref:thiamine pyrophosphate-binding protein n=1 Tax=Conexibacter sp. W3-3-2 TaxID=2675227 RepID=UPI001329F226|nr:thiamine pyrophosphate-binding protein [Conexibacter sp. W3-3-2]MTD45071.1 thiamine pyrophosphate-binding protein [Conexibacter sp. W3-3-2]